MGSVLILRLWRSTRETFLAILCQEQAIPSRVERDVEKLQDRIEEKSAIEAGLSMQMKNTSAYPQAKSQVRYDSRPRRGSRCVGSVRPFVPKDQPQRYEEGLGLAQEKEDHFWSAGGTFNSG